jgi:hypothetical protein
MTIDKDDQNVMPPTEADFQGNQLEIFRSFLCNNDNERERLSNTFDLWDSIPRYAVSRQQMNKIREEKGFLPLQHVNFQYRQKPYEVRIQAARIYDEKTKTETDYYPSANEELIEDALRKIAAEQRNGFFDQPNFRSGVVFTLYMLREELKRRGHSRSYQQIILSLYILSGSIMDMRGTGKDSKKAFQRYGYFSAMTAVSKEQLEKDPHAKWIVQFNPLVTQAIDNLTYRQYNYAQMMSHQTQLARWIHKLLSLKFTFASLASPFEIRYSTIKRDSGLLNSYKLERQAIAALDAAFNELKTAGVLMSVVKNDIRSSRGKLEDVVYTLTASMAFIAETKAANKRENMAIEKKNDTRK